MKPSDFVSTSEQKNEAAQSVLQTEMTDAVNSGIVGRADKSDRALKGKLFESGKRTSKQSPSHAPVLPRESDEKTDGKPGAKGGAGLLARTAAHKALEGSELEGADDIYHTVKRTSRTARRAAARLSGTPSKGSRHVTAKATARRAVNSALQDSELEGIDSFYDTGKAVSHAFRRGKKAATGTDPTSSNRSLGKLSEKKYSAAPSTSVEAKRVAQAKSYFKRNVYSAAESARAAATAAKEGALAIGSSVRAMFSPLLAASAPVIGFALAAIMLVFVLSALITSIIGSEESEQSNFGTLSGIQLEVAQALRDSGLQNAQIAAVMGNISGESSWNPTAEYHGEKGEFGFGLFQFTDAPAQGVYNYTAFANWCSANGKDKNSAAVQTSYFMERLPGSWMTALHDVGYYSSSAPQFAGRDASYQSFLSTQDVSFATYCFMACYERPASWAAKESFPNTRLPAAQTFYEQLTSGGEQNYEAADSTQKAIVDAAKRTPSPGAGYCAAWVSNVYENAGLPRPGGNACCMYRSFCTSTDRSQLKVGMVIGVQRSPTSNSNSCGDHLGYGHVGIYIGNGKVMENIGHIATTDLDQWLSYNGKLCQPKWGYPPGVH